ncbi:MAG TPA: hypothetical protein VKT21_06855 [Thermoplasmata archaeon]|nr:hypothetical protein [Thermoplasmata archaeon]
MRLPFWSRPTPDERQHAIATLTSLGTTSVPGLAAALSWSIPRTEKVLRELSRRGPAGLVSDARTGTIRWGVPTSPPARPPPPQPTGGPGPSWALSAARGPARSDPTAVPSTVSPPPARAAAYRPTIVPPAPSATPRGVPNDHALRECARCHTPLVPTGDADVFACPMCGRRLTGSGTLVSPSPSRPSAPAGPDAKVQQLIAAWATGQPAPCPRCRQPLRHTMDGEFRCGACGTRVAYGAPSASPPPLSAGPVLGPSR